MLNFDEFRAVNNREKSKLVAKQPQTDTSQTPRKVSSENESKETFNVNIKQVIEPPANNSFIFKLMTSMGEFLEMHQMQGIYIFLVLLDTFAALAEVYLTYLSNRNVLLFIDNGPLLKALKSFSTFTSLFFICEILAIFLVFRTKAVGHFGYIIDLIIIIYQANSEHYGGNKFCKLLNIFRFWRVFRVFNSKVQAEKAMHHKTQELLDVTDERLRQCELQLSGLREELSKESDARRAIEDMLQSYKDEVDTLNEALKIAAMDIAEVAQPDDDDDLDSLDDKQLLDDEESEDVLSVSAAGGGSVSNSSGGGGFGRRSNKSAIMRAVMNDSQRRLASSMHPVVDGEPRVHKGGTFVVHEDGSFEHR